MSTDPTIVEAEVPIDASGVDPDVDFMETERALYDAEHHVPERKLSETLLEMAEEFAEKFSEGACKLSELEAVGWDDDKYYSIL